MSRCAASQIPKPKKRDSGFNRNAGGISQEGEARETGLRGRQQRYADTVSYFRRYLSLQVHAVDKGERRLNALGDFARMKEEVGMDWK